jgi:hypothetical protein
VPLCQSPAGRVRRRGGTGRPIYNEAAVVLRRIPWQGTPARYSSYTLRRAFLTYDSHNQP